MHFILLWQHSGHKAGDETAPAHSDHVTAADSSQQQLTQTDAEQETTSTPPPTTHHNKEDGEDEEGQEQLRATLEAWLSQVMQLEVDDEAGKQTTLLCHIAVREPLEI